MIANGRLWRASNSSLNKATRQQHVNELILAIRSVATALKTKSSDALREAPSKVQQAKVELGERGPVWWTDGALDYNRKLVINTPYKQE